jgi:hypothetical protein
MPMDKRLCDEDFLILALRHYENPQCESLEEFYEDLSRIKYIKRLLNRNGEEDDGQRNRLALNHIIVMTNVFGMDMGSRILFFRMDERYHPQLKAFLLFLNMLPREIPEMDLSKIQTDSTLLEELRKL